VGNGEIKGRVRCLTRLISRWQITTGYQVQARRDTALAMRHMRDNSTFPWCPNSRAVPDAADAEISSANCDRRNWVPPQRPTPYVVLTCGETELARWPLPGGHDPDLSVVDLLARLHLVARRLGCSIRLSDPPGALLALIELAGLSGVIVAGTTPDGTTPDGAREGPAQYSAQDLAPVEVDGGGGEDRDQPDRPDQHG
jgi:hypothetical protein